MANVGYATLTIIPSAKGFAKKLRGETGGALSAAGKSGGVGFGGAFVGATAAKFAKGFGGPVGIITSILGGLALKGGFSRALGIEDAQAKLRGLGHDSKSIEKIMESALGSVKGTAFGLDTAATTAAGAVAAGIKPGKELTDYLRLTADAATIAGVSMGEMGSILNKTTTSGRAYTQELNQLADRGIPIFQWLADEYGVNATELRKMVAAGKVDSETFRKVIEENIGGAALASGETTRGAWANTKAAFSRFGAEIATRVLPLIRTGLVGLTGVIDSATNAFGGLLDGLGGMGAGAGAATGPLADLLAALGPIWETVTTKLLPALQRFGDAILTGVQPVLQVLGDIIRESIVPALTEIAEKAAPLVGRLVETFDVLSANVGPILQGIADLIRNVWGFIGPFVMAVLGGLVDNVIGVFDGLLSVIQGVVTMVAGIFQGDWAKAWEGLKMIVSGAVKAVWNLLQLWLFGRVVKLVGGALRAVRGVFTNMWNGIVSFVKGIGAKLGATARSFMDGIRLRVMYGLDAVKGFFSKIWNGIASLVVRVASRIGSAVAGFIGRVRSTVSGGLNAVRGFFSTAWNAAFSLVRGAFLKIVSSVRTGITNVMGYVRGLPGKIKAKLSNLGNLLKNAGRTIIDGFLKGLKGAWDNVTGFVGGIAGWIADNKGPLPYDRRLLIPAGKAIMEGLGKGLEGELGSLKGTLDNITGSIVDQVQGRIADGGKAVAKAAHVLAPKVPAFSSPRISPDGSVAGSVAAAVSGVSASGTSITLNGVEGDPRAFADALTHALRRARRGGVYAPGGNA